MPNVRRSSHVGQSWFSQNVGKAKLRHTGAVQLLHPRQRLNLISPINNVTACSFHWFINWDTQLQLHFF
jgi:hypothetical protein